MRALLGRLARGSARFGLVARAVFYLLLAYLVLRIAVEPGGRQANANGALRLVGSTTFDSVVLGFVGAGFAAFGLVRLRAAVVDRDADRTRRVTTVLQGLAGLVVAYVPFSFALGRTDAGSEESQRRGTAQLLGLPGGRGVVVVVGLVVLGWSAWQVRGALRRDHEHGLDLPLRPPSRRRLLRLVAATGLVARAVVIAPIGVFLVVAGFTYDPADARGLDGELLLLARHGWGTAVLAVVALGLLDFAAYALVEARYRDVGRA